MQDWLISGKVLLLWVKVVRLLTMICIDASVKYYIDNLICFLLYIVLEPILKQTWPMPARQLPIFNTIIYVKDEWPEAEQIIQFLHHFWLNLRPICKHVMLNLLHIILLCHAYKIIRIATGRINIPLPNLDNSLLPGFLPLSTTTWLNILWLSCQLSYLLCFLLSCLLCCYLC